MNMGTRMKTTVDLAPDLLEAAKAEARRRGITLRAIVEEGLQRLLDSPPPEWELDDATVTGNGIRPEFRGRSFDELRDHIYQGRGA